MPSVHVREPLAGGLAVTRDRVQLHLVELTGGVEDVARAEREVTPEEAARASRGTAGVRSRRLLLRAALRRVVGAELGVAPVQVPIRTSSTGRPWVAGRPDLDISCSASGGLGLVALARGRRVGVDIERLTAWSDDVLDENWLTDGERHSLTALPPAARSAAATRCWTHKEAVLKGRGTGLLEAPASVVTPVGALAGMVAGWRIEDVPVPQGWVATLATAPLEEGRA